MDYARKACTPGAESIPPHVFRLRSASVPAFGAQGLRRREKSTVTPAPAPWNLKDQFTHIRRQFLNERTSLLTSKTVVLGYLEYTVLALFARGKGGREKTVLGHRPKIPLVKVSSPKGRELLLAALRKIAPCGYRRWKKNLKNEG